MEFCEKIFDLLEKTEKELRNKIDYLYVQKFNNMHYFERVVTKKGEIESSSYFVKLSLTNGYNNLIKKKKYLEEIKKKSIKIKINIKKKKMNIVKKKKKLMKKLTI